MLLNKNVLVIAILILFSIFSYFNFNILINKSKENGYIINIAGMQRMLSQKIAFNIYLLKDTNLKEYESSLKSLIDIMYQNQIKIDEFETRDNIKATNKNSEKINEDVFKYLKKAEVFLKNRDNESFQYIQNNKNILLKDLNEVVNIFEAYNSNQISKIRKVSLLLFILSIILSLYIYFVILKPITDKLKKSKNDLEIQHKKLYERTKEIREKNRELKRYVQMVDENVITSTTDLKGIITYVSEAFCKISGYTKKELIGKPHNIVRDPDMPKEIYKELWKTIKEDMEWSGEIKNMKKDGGYYWVLSKIAPLYDKNKKIGYISIRQDITDKKRVEELSITDGLTGLYNRRYFNEIFTKEIARSKRDGKYLSFLILDIDHFKQYNDTYGHQAGDEVLKSVAKALKGSIHRGSDFVFRLGGEEFGIIFSDLNEEASVEFANVVRKAIEELKIEHSKNSASSFVTSSFGLVVQKGKEIKSDDEIYKLADEGLYEAKESGRNRVVLSK